MLFLNVSRNRATRWPGGAANSPGQANVHTPELPMSDDVDEGKSILVPHTFNTTEIIEVEYQGKPVFLAQQVGAALGYADPDKLANNIVQKWSDDFEEGRDFLKLTNGRLAEFKAAVNCRPDRAAVVDPRTPNLILLTEAGAQLAAILSRTSQGRAFRRWLLDVVLVAWRARQEPPPSARTPGPAPKRERRAPKALPGPRTLKEHRYNVGIEDHIARAYNDSGAVHPWGGVRDHLVGQLLLILKDQTSFRPDSWRLQLIEMVARQAGLTLATFEGDPDLAAAREDGSLLNACARDLVDRLSDLQLVGALASAARQSGVLAVIDVAQVRHEGWRWTRPPSFAEEMAQIRERLDRAEEHARKGGGR